MTHSVGFFGECQTAEDWMKAKEEILNNRFSVSEFKLEEGEALHKEMQELRDELSAYEDEVQVQGLTQTLLFLLLFWPRKIDKRCVELTSLYHFFCSV